MINLFDLSKKQMESFFEHLGEKKFRATQVMKWIYHEGETDFDKMLNISKSFRETLKKEACLVTPRIVTRQDSSDGTIKWMLQIPENNAIEVVYIPESDRGTLCISSQAGCILACPFCSTGHEGFNRNLSTGEMISQVWLAMKEIGWQKSGKRNITNVVLMGMGEPLLNYNNVIRACNLMLSDLGFGLSKRRVTLSTSGVVPGIYNMIKDTEISLAVSLHAPNNELRDVIVPINKKYPLEELIESCRQFVLQSGSKKHITWEYLMLRDVNDTIEHARQLEKLIKGFSGKVNLIPFNEVKGTPYRQSTKEQVDKFFNFLVKKGVVVTIRKTRGEDIVAACGQLVGDIKDKSRRERLLVRNKIKQV